MNERVCKKTAGTNTGLKARITTQYAEKINK